MRHKQLTLLVLILMGISACSIRVGVENPPSALATMNSGPTATPQPAPTEAAAPLRDTTPIAPEAASSSAAPTPSDPVARYLMEGVSTYPAAPVIEGSGGALLYAVHEPSTRGWVQYDTTLMMLALSASGDPEGAAQVWYEWTKYDHAGMYALPDHSGVVERTAFEAGNNAALTRPAAVESWSIGAPIGSTFPSPLGWTVDSQGLLFIAVVEGRTTADSRSALVLVRADGAHILLEGTNVAGAALSPDGSVLVYSRYEGSNIEGTVWRLDIASGAVENIAAEIMIDLAWSPDGQWIAGEINGRVYIMRPDGTDLQRVSDASTYEIYEPLQWSPTGDALLFTAFAGQAPLTLQDPDAFAFQYTSYIAGDRQRGCERGAARHAGQRRRVYRPGVVAGWTVDPGGGAGGRIGGGVAGQPQWSKRAADHLRRGNEALSGMARAGAVKRKA